MSRYRNNQSTETGHIAYGMDILELAVTPAVMTVGQRTVDWPVQLSGKRAEKGQRLCVLFHFEEVRKLMLYQLTVGLGRSHTEAGCQ